MNARRSMVLLAGICTGLGAISAKAQESATAPAAQQSAPAQGAAQNSATMQGGAAPAAQEPREAAAGNAAEKGQSFEPNEIRAWQMLTDAAKPGQSAHDRVQAMAALGTMGTDERAARLIEEGFTAKDYDVRTAAVLAAGLTKNPKLIEPLERVLDDDNAQVAYTAAITLWRMHNYSGQDLLSAVALGEEKAQPGLIKSQKHKAAKELRSPKTMGLIAVNQASGYFIGPFGVGLKAIEMVNKDSGAAPRAAAIDQLSHQHTPEVHEVLVQGLTAGEPAVRAASAKGLGRWDDEETAKLVAPMFADTKLAVRLTAAATYLKAVHHIPTPPDGECEF